MSKIEYKTLEHEIDENQEAVVENEKGAFKLKGRLLGYWHEGFYEPGWELWDYNRAAVDNYGWENYPRWGIKGSKKSNQLMRDLYEIYGDWELVHKYMVMTPLEFTELLKEALDNKSRIPMIGWDDIAAWFDSQLYFENRGLYTNTKRCWTLMRTKLNVFESTLPNKEELPGFILKDITAEVKNSPRCTYTYDRWTWQKHLFDPGKVNKRPVNVSRNEKFNYTDIPLKEFKRYHQRRMELADVATNDLVSYLEEAFDDTPDPTPEELEEQKNELSEWGRALANRRWSKAKNKKK